MGWVHHLTGGRQQDDGQILPTGNRQQDESQARQSTISQADRANVIEIHGLH
jgi:hypothetical protein